MSIFWNKFKIFTWIVWCFTGGSGRRTKVEPVKPVNMTVESLQRIRAPFGGIYISLPGFVVLWSEIVQIHTWLRKVGKENGVVLLHGVRWFGRGCGSYGAEQEQQGSNQHLFRIQFLQEQLPPRLFPHDGYISIETYSLPSIAIEIRWMGSG